MTRNWNLSTDCACVLLMVSVYLFWQASRATMVKTGSAQACRNKIAWRTSLANTNELNIYSYVWPHGLLVCEGNLNILIRTAIYNNFLIIWFFKMANNTQDISLRTEDDIFGQDIIGISKSKTMLAGGKGPGREAGSKITFKEPKGKSNHGRHGSKMRSNKNKGKSKDQGITIPILAPSQASPERAKYLIKVQSKLAEDSSLDPTID